nr:copia LTR rider [Tanacetum cinerariifolium]
KDRINDVSPKIVTSRNAVFNESVMYKDTLKDSGASDKSVEELQVGVELQRLNNHALEEDQTYQEDGDDEDAGDQATDQPPDLIDYQLVRDREPRTRTKPLRFQDESNMAAYTFPRYKARLVARGFTQRAGIDYNEVFSLIVRHTSIRVILALTTCKDYELEQLDVKTTFLHGNLKDVIYMKQPPGYEQGNKVCLLKKSLYGLKQSPRQWYKRFDEYMLNNRFKRSSYDSCVYYRSYALGAVCKCGWELNVLDGVYEARHSVCVYGTNRGNHVDVEGFVDSDYAKDPDKGREVLEVKTVKVLHVGTEHNVADALTNVVPGLKLQHFLELLNVGVG